MIPVFPSVRYCMAFSFLFVDVWSAPRGCVKFRALENGSPRDRAVFPARERTCRAVAAEQCNAHRLAGALFDRLRTRITVEVRLGEARGDGVHLNPLRLQLDRHGDCQSIES